MSKLTIIIVVGLLITITDRSVTAAPNSSSVTSEYHQGDFKLVSRGGPADILISPNDFKVVRIAAADFALDANAE
jgi:hypothetical protein